MSAFDSCPYQTIGFAVAMTLIIILIITLIIFIICYRNVKRIYAKTLQELSIRLTALEGGLAKKGGLIKVNPVVVKKAQTENADMKTAREMEETARSSTKSKKRAIKEITVTVDGIPMTTVDEKARKKTSEDKQAINPPAVEQPVKQPAAQQPAQPTPQQSTPAVAKLEKSVTARDD
ncbi:hypothetical protein M3Y95_00357900 [Aphelenchoides besseyi]|nr:hypothetical protein M3Y95_00357900 [Aphelenchoides besseyi]